MIKVFRKIRQNLLMKGKTGKYLNYAIGEIVLVVIGILIALQINTWNETRKLSNQESLYINRLIAENRSDLTILSAEIERLTGNNEKIAAFSEAFKDSECSDSLLVHCAREFMIYGSAYPRFNPSTSTYEDLSSTGNLGIIKDPGLRDQIVAHYHGYRYTDWSFNVNSDWAMPVDAPLYIETDALVFDTVYTSHLFPDQTTEKLAEELRVNQKTFLRNAALHYWINEDCISDLNRSLMDINDFIEVLESANHE